MNLDLNNKVENKNKDNTEVNTFIEELNNSLKKENRYSTIIANEIYNNNPLAIKYKDKFEDIVNECMRTLSYESNFYYFDYDKINNIYYLDRYTKGEVDRAEYTEKEFKDENFKLGSFWGPYEKDKIVEANYFKNAVAVEVDMKLHELEAKNKKR